MSPNKLFSAEVLCQHGVNTIDIYIVIRDKKGNEIKRKNVITELPDEYAYAKHLGKLIWENNNEVLLINKKGTDGWSVDIE